MDELRNPICFARCIWRSLTRGRYISGHKFKTANEATPENIHILRCKDCGHNAIAWSWGSLEEFK